MTHRTLAAASVITVALAENWFWLSRQSNEPTLETVLSQAGVVDASSVPKDAPVASLAEIASTVPTEAATIQRSAPASAFARRQAIYAAASQANERRLRTLIAGPSVAGRSRLPNAVNASALNPPRNMCRRRID